MSTAMSNVARVSRFAIAKNLLIVGGTVGLGVYLGEKVGCYAADWFNEGMERKEKQLLEEKRKRELSKYTFPPVRFDCPHCGDGIALTDPEDKIKVAGALRYTSDD